MERSLIFIASAAALYWGLKGYYGKHDGSVADKPNTTYFWISGILAFGLICGTPYFGTKIPGSFFERANYEGMFYADLISDGQNTESYRVPAFITASVKRDPIYDDRSYPERKYRIEYAIMPNGAKLRFLGEGEHLDLEKSVAMVDDRGKKWRVQLTDERSNN